ncbi:unnamed protein product [Fraxinus pennsylvanica]|uniref:Uncharacterized protein n=1 Tax=Fraxinus pennsylvanica TaxID=56036 RepID=A0AAD2E1X8_9LAMI|nr:unnamed protein product [Fraxinus pennsylvanica]
MNILKQSVLEYVSFMDMNIKKASTSNQIETFDLLGAKMAQALELPSLKISSDFRLMLKIIHSEISSLPAKNVELKAKKIQYLNVVIEKESLLQELEKTKSNLRELSSEVKEVERGKSLLERYSKLDVDEGLMTELSTSSDEQRNEWEKLREQMRSLWGRL